MLHTIKKMISDENNVSDPVITSKKNNKRPPKRSRPLSRKFSCRQTRKKKRDEEIKINTYMVEEEIQVPEVEEEEDEVGDTIRVIEEIIELDENEEMEVTPEIQELQIKEEKTNYSVDV
ncbi:uncharacterized protein LOC130672215 [Microplitis mediator]|uniref:uncharacterized protein LOC130672215 n=1 Tax=Microplitis mediator TaxID=375433 RepID=UPI002556FFF2|nr:uncharacterized protein LOC130672215 [Microplitis mediator]